MSTKRSAEVAGLEEPSVWRALKCVTGHLSEGYYYMIHADLVLPESADRFWQEAVI